MENCDMAKKRRGSETVEAVRECQQLNEEGSSWGYKLFAGLEAELTPGERRRANQILEGRGLPTFQGEASTLGSPLQHRRPSGGLGSAAHG